ncbi:MAG: M56 family metallopeptidase [Tannerella sp.]|jgi:TonB family protein|nr:M56 family metallopeptidase [Tannerella sp.]
MEIFVFLIKVNIAIILLYGFYCLLFRNDTFFHWKRWLLLSVIMLSLLYPLWNIPVQIIESELFTQTVESRIIFPSFYLNEVIVWADTGQANTARSIWNHIPEMLLGIYVIGFIYFIVKILIQIAEIAFLLAGTKPVEINGRKIYVKKGLKTPFSFFKYIVLDPESYTENELREILRHEETHAGQWHSADMMIAECMCATCWFNPFIWLMKRAIRINLEYMADRSVIDAGCDIEHYQFHLLRLTYHKATVKIINNFNVSPLKKRILMMNKKQTSKSGMAKYILVLPLVAALLVFNSLDVLSSKNQLIEHGITGRESAYLPTAVQDGDLKAQNGTNVVIMEPNAKDIINIVTSKKVTACTDAAIVGQNVKDSIYATVEQMPQFPGGDVALLKCISDSIRYPYEAATQKIQGRVYVTFVVTAKGKITDVKVAKSVHPLLDAEAVRCVKALPGVWTPGKDKGKPVSVFYTVPISFRLTMGSQSQDQEPEKK